MEVGKQAKNIPLPRRRDVMSDKRKKGVLGTLTFY